MDWVLIFFMVVFPSLSVFNQKSEPPKLQIDCSGLISQREFGTIDGHRIMINGEYAVGQFIGKSFVPVLHFNTLNEATSCAPNMEVAKWQNGTWVRP
jgi:hypothetical protein